MTCGYNLRGLPEPRCPECGQVFSIDDKATYYATKPTLIERCFAKLKWAAPWLGWSLLLVLLVSIVVSVFMPSTDHRHPPINYCASSMRELYKWMAIYHNDFDSYPSELADMVDVGDAEFDKKLWDRLRCWQNKRKDLPELGLYYVAGLKEEDPDTWIVLYEMPDDHKQQRGVIQYLGGHMEWLDKNAFLAEIRRFKKEYKVATGNSPRILKQ